ncbi:SpoIIAA family protein [Mucilaginibacter arboris]|uniref:STAS/SEC14 domain-containing protein n=1 Tax=Mucilaginibacter arboris TaxID=2682090 RepID=A0A7K1SSS7_9SPHI|nr:STAS/SEC14 domain-containing protein [Mucilaginibacter arboris]MVN20368.1 STAS/SEC14 domain-containing protein [Mucilaginibacter arboris]
MIEVMTDVPANVVGFRATGKVEKTDYDQTVVPELNKHVSKNGEINFLLVLKTDVGNYSLGAVAADLKEGVKHFTKWHRMAIVTDQKGLEKFSDLASFALPGESKGFELAELEEAKKWVSEG